MVLTNLSQPHAPLAPTNDATPAGGAGNVVVPVYSSWFEFGKIHEIERRSLPEFFTQPTATEPAHTVAEDKTPSAYMEYRDFMVQTYRLRPQDYLTITTCRRHLTGDVGAIIRVHAFLEQWGLINFQVAGSGRSSGTGGAAQIGRVPLDIPTAIIGAVQNTALTRSVTAPPTSKKGPANSLGVITCTQCHVECPRLYYTHMLATGSTLNLCGLCYAEGRYPTALYSGDFVKVDVAAMEQGMRLAWTDEETLLLLSALEEHSNDWDAVAGKVGRSKDQCLFQFLRLPGIEAVEGAVLERTGEEVAKITPIAGSIPFRTCENPLMSTLAFLASAVHPKVAAAAAQAALNEIQQLKASDNSMQIDVQATPSSDALEHIAATGLACASAKATCFLDEDAKRSAKLRETLLELHLQKLRVKLGIFEDLERSLDDDRKDLEQQRLQLFFDRFNLRKQMLAIEQKTAAAEGRLEMADHSLMEKPLDDETSAVAEEARKIVKL